MSVAPKNTDEAIADYFYRAPGDQEDAVNFDQSFGISLPDFSKKVNDWIKRSIGKLGSKEIKWQGDIEPYIVIDEAFNHSQIFLQDNFGEIVHSKQWITLAPEKHSYLSSLTKELRLTRPQAEQIAAVNPWWATGNKVVMNLGVMPDYQLQFYQTAMMMTMQFQNQQDSKHLLNNMVWLRYGMAQVLAASISQQADVAAPDYYRKLWSNSVGNAATSLTLADLQTEAGWNRAVVRYGDPAVKSYAALAALYLTDHNGLTSFQPWLSKSKESLDSEAAFVKAFGKGSKELGIDFQTFISNGQKP